MARFDRITSLGAVILALTALAPSLSAQTQFAPVQTHTLPGGVIGSKEASALTRAS
jgi:hypothetical protein